MFVARNKVKLNMLYCLFIDATQFEQLEIQEYSANILQVRYAFV